MGRCCVEMLLSFGRGVISRFSIKRTLHLTNKFGRSPVPLYLLSSTFTHMSSSDVNLLDRKKVFTYEKSSTPTELVGSTNMTAFLLIWGTDAAAVMSMDHFTVVSSVTWPLNGNEAGYRPRCAAGRTSFLPMSVWISLMKIKMTNKTSKFNNDDH